MSAPCTQLEKEDGDEKEASRLHPEKGSVLGLGEEIGKKLWSLGSSVVGKRGKRKCGESQGSTHGETAESVWSLDLSKKSGEAEKVAAKRTHSPRNSEKFLKDSSGKDVL